MRKKILIAAGAVALIGLVVILIAIGVNREATAPSVPFEEESSSVQTAEDTTLPTSAEAAGETGSQATSPSGTTNGNTGVSGGQPASTAPAQTQSQFATAPLGDFEEGVEVWQDTQPAATTPADPQTTVPAQTQPTEETTVPSQKSLTYEAYLQLSNTEQQAYFRSFDTVDAFYDWLDAAQAEYEKTHPGGSGSGSVDIGDYIP